MKYSQNHRTSNRNSIPDKQQKNTPQHNHNTNNPNAPAASGAERENSFDSLQDEYDLNLGNFLKGPPGFR